MLTLAEKIKIRRERLNLTQKDLSLKTGLTSQYISNLETEKKFINGLRKRTMEALASALNTTVPELFYSEEAT